MIFKLIWAGVLGILLTHVAVAYWQSEGATVAERLKNALRRSATVGWARLNSLSVLLVGAVTEVAPLVGLPGVADAIKPWLQPEYLSAYTVFVLIGSELARRRTL